MQLSDGIKTVELPKDLLWINEHSWSPVVMQSAYSVTGAFIIETNTKLAGREITLQSPPSQSVISHATLEILKTWRNVPGKTLVLTIRGGTKNVQFKQDETALEIELIGGWCDDDTMTNALYFITLKFIEV